MTLTSIEKKGFVHQLIKALLKSKVLFAFQFLLLLNSCSNSANDKQVQQDSTTQNSTPKVRVAQQQDPNCCDNLLDIEVDFKVLKNLYQKNDFYKFQLFPYQLDTKDHLRLYGFALDKSENELEGNQRFYISADGKERHPWSETSVIIYPGLALFKEDIDASKWPKDGKKIKFKSVKDVEAEGNLYRSYSVFVDDKPTGLTLKPSPPAKLILEKLYADYFMSK